jgi:hypothetical protein
MDIFLVWHVHHAARVDGRSTKQRNEDIALRWDAEEGDDHKLLGAYSSRHRAKSASSAPASSLDSATNRTASSSTPTYSARMPGAMATSPRGVMVLPVCTLSQLSHDPHLPRSDHPVRRRSITPCVDVGSVAKAPTSVGRRPMPGRRSALRPSPWSLVSDHGLRNSRSHSPMAAQLHSGVASRTRRPECNFPKATLRSATRRRPCPRVAKGAAGPAAASRWGCRASGDTGQRGPRAESRSTS